jgi:hypothetical protein
LPYIFFVSALEVKSLASFGQLVILNREAEMPQPSARGALKFADCLSLKEARRSINIA